MSYSERSSRRCSKRTSTCPSDDRPELAKQKILRKNNTPSRSDNASFTKRNVDVQLGDSPNKLNVNSSKRSSNSCAIRTDHGSNTINNDCNSPSSSLSRMDHFASFEIDFMSVRDRVPVLSPYMPPLLHLTSKNMFHYVSNAVLGKASRDNFQALSQRLSSNIAGFEIVDNDHPFKCRITTLDWHPRENNFIAIGSKHGDLKFYKVGHADHSRMEEVYMSEGIGPGGYISAFKFHPENQHQFYTSSLCGKVCCRSLDDRTFSVLHDTGSWDHWFCSLDVHRSEKLLAAGQSNGWVHLMCREGGEIWQKRLHRQKVSHAEFSPRDPSLLCTASLDHSVRLWDLRMMVEKTPLACLQHEKGVNSAYFSLTDGCRLLTTDQHSEIRVYDAPFWHLERKIIHPHRFFQHITPIKAYWHPCRDLIVCGRFPDQKLQPQFEDKRYIDFFDADTGDLTCKIKDVVHTGIVSLCKFNKTGDKLLTAMGYGVNLWNKEAEVDLEKLSTTFTRTAGNSSADLTKGPPRVGGLSRSRPKVSEDGFKKRKRENSASKAQLKKKMQVKLQKEDDDKDWKKKGRKK